MICWKCGKEIEKEGLFCKYCGAKIEESEKIGTPEGQDKLEGNGMKGNHLKKGITLTPKVRLVMGACAILVILAVVYLSTTSGPVNDYLALVKGGEVAQAAELYTTKIQGDENKETKVREKCLEEIKKIETTYLANQLDYKTATKQMEGYAHVLKGVKEYSDAKKTMESMENSRIAYMKAVEFEKAKNPGEAMEQYGKVIEQDPNFTDAQKKIMDLRDDFQKATLKKADELANTGSFRDAISKIDGALKILGDDTQLTTMKKTLLVKQEEAKKAREAAEREQQKLYAGKQVVKSGLEVTYKNAKLTTKIVPDNTGGSFYLYYTAPNEEIFLDLTFSVKNISGYSVNIENIFNQVQVTYDNTYTYRNFSTYFSSGREVSPVYSWDSIEPLKTITYHVTVALPREAATSSKPISINFYTHGEAQFLQFR